MQDGQDNSATASANVTPPPYGKAERRQHRVLALWVLLGCWSVYLLTASFHGPLVGDATTMMTVATNLATTGLQASPDGSTWAFSKYGLGQSLLDLPVAWLVRPFNEATGMHKVWLAVALTVPAAFYAALHAVLTLLVVLELRYRRSTALLVALLVAFTSLVWSSAAYLYADGTLGLAWLAAFYGLLRWRATGGHWAWLGLTGFGMGFALLLKVVGIIGFPVFGLAVLTVAVTKFAPVDSKIRRREMRRAALALVVPLLIIGLLCAGYNHLRYDNFLNFGYDDPRDRDTIYGFGTPWLVGLYGLLFSSGKSFFLYNAPTVLSLLGWRWLRRRDALSAWICLGLCAGLVGLHIRWWAWHGDWSYGPRFLLGLPAFAYLPLAPWIERLGGRARRWWRDGRTAWLAGLATIGVAVQVIGVLYNPTTFFSLATQSTTIFAGGHLWENYAFEIRDEGVMLHFVPEFNPIAGHLWLLHATWQRHDPAQRDETLRNPPWRTLNPAWVPVLTDPAFRYLTYDVWWLFAAKEKLPDRGSALAAAAALALLAAAAFVMAARCSRDRQGERAERDREGGIADR